MISKCKGDEIAKLAVLLYDNAIKGDAASIELFRRAGCELGEIVNSLINKLDFEGQSEIKLACSGGVFKAGKYISEPLMKSINDARIKLVTSVLSPVVGAAYYALINGIKDDLYKEVVKNLEECDEIMKRADREYNI